MITKGYMVTWSGKEFSILNPQPEQIVLEDICHHLAQLNRFNGACLRPYSVAEHTLIAYEIMKKETQDPLAHLEVLLHDAHEAYYGDIISPLKQIIGEDFFRLVETTQRLINQSILGYEEFKHQDIVDMIDLRLGCTEARDLLPYTKAWWEPDVPYGDIKIPMTACHWEVYKMNLWRAILALKEKIKK